MSTTIKELLTEKYIELQQNIRMYTDVQIFPSLDDYELYELIYYFNTYFFNFQDREETVKQIIKSKEIVISEDVFKIIYPYINSFLDFFHQLMKKHNN
jgi:hypothetical protein